ncbi:MAG: hypothetical protein IPI58_02210 [Alphaproteobacteria bacterium]|nr:MAG: hypothetical protein IPI58_02210 [Alphaproteobacteria bacterium]
MAGPVVITPFFSHGGEEPAAMDEMEILRNAAGEWLIILPHETLGRREVPGFAQIRLESHRLVLVPEKGREFPCFHSGLSEIIHTLHQEAPLSVLIAEVDSEGVQRLCYRLPTTATYII